MPYTIEDLLAAQADLLEAARDNGTFFHPMTVEPTGRGYYEARFSDLGDLQKARRML